MEAGRGQSSLEGAILQYIEADHSTGVFEQIAPPCT